MISQRTEDGATLIAFLVDVLEGREPKAKVADRLEAARLLMDRAWGKPVQALEVSGPEGAALGMAALDGLTTEELRQMAAHRETLIAQRETLIAQRERLLALLEAQGQTPALAQPSGDAPDSQRI